MGAIQFIESLDRSSLTITDEEFERNVEAAVAAIAEKPPPSPVTEEETQRGGRQPRGHQGQRRLQNLDGSSRGEGSSARLRSVSPRPIIGPVNATSASTSSNSNNNSNNMRNVNNNTSSSSDSDTDDAVVGLLRTIGKPLSTIGRILGEATGALGDGETPGSTPRQRSPTAGRGAGTRGAVRGPDGGVGGGTGVGLQGHSGRNHGLTAEEAAARQASAESAEALRIERAEHEDVVELLKGMFPGLDRDLISDVVVEKQGR